MSAYEIRLKVLSDEGIFPVDIAYIMARDPFPEVFEFPISHQCMSYIEVEYEVERLKKALDKVKVQARKKFERHR